MATADEAAEARTPMGANLAAGVNMLSLDQVVTFTAYIRVVLPLDGYVFWVRSGITTQSSVLNVNPLNVPVLNGAAVTVVPDTIDAQGSLHIATDQSQTEPSTYAINRVVFTSLVEVQDLNLVDDDILYIAEFDGVRFAFSSRASFYKQANLYHYVGHAIYSWMESQIIDYPAQLNARELIVSNSLPAWLALNLYRPTIPVPVPLPRITLYPSFLVPSNLPPPFGAVHIDPGMTKPIQMAPIFDRRTGSYLFTSDTVTITLYGATNAVAIDFRDAVLQYTLDTDAFGLTNTPVVMDDKQIQNELNAIAMRKHITFEVNYYQQNMRDLARQLILSCVPAYYIGDQLITST